VGASRVDIKISVSSGEKGYREFPVRAEIDVPPIPHHRSRRAPMFRVGLREIVGAEVIVGDVVGRGGRISNDIILAK